MFVPRSRDWMTTSAVDAGFGIALSCAVGVPSLRTTLSSMRTAWLGSTVRGFVSVSMSSTRTPEGVRMVSPF